MCTKLATTMPVVLRPMPICGVEVMVGPLGLFLGGGRRWKAQAPSALQAHTPVHKHTPTTPGS